MIELAVTANNTAAVMLRITYNTISSLSSAFFLKKYLKHDPITAPMAGPIKDITVIYGLKNESAMKDKIIRNTRMKVG